MQRLLAKNSKVKQGDVIGKRTVIGQPFKVKVMERGATRNRVFCVCRCECGTAEVVNAIYLRRAGSCGCGQVASLAAANTKHGQCDTSLYNVWKCIKYRCFGKNFSQFADYGGRGITVCDQWRRDFTAFRDWAMANGYRDGLEIDRRNNDLGYNPENCRFVERIANQRNKRSNHVIEAFGEKKPMVEWAEDARCVVGYRTLRSRMRYGWTGEKAIATPAGGDE